MLFGGRRTSSNVEHGERAGGFGGGGFGGAGAGMLLSLVFSRFGIGGVVVLLLIMFLFSGNPLGLSGGGQQAVPDQQAGSTRSADQVCGADSTVRFACQVLASTEERWGEMFAQAGSRYEPPVMRVYRTDTAGACGVGQAQMGPFYCPLDRKIYIDPAFFAELEQRHGARGDFAQAYVIAHEVGHHVQTITGTAQRIRDAQSRVSRRDANALQVRMELQADCYAGLWAARERAAMEPDDFQEGMTAAAAIGDDTLQRAGQGHVVPESFTHGTAAQRQEALQRGYASGGDPAACESYTAGI